jgi:uncharacterized protein YciI
MLQLRPNCQCCDADLPGDSGEAFICSYECTFCRDCAANALQGRCPNCGGELLRRPRRPPAKLAKDPASTARVLRPGGAPPAPARTDGHFLLFYEGAPDYFARRGEFRAEHLRLAWAAQARGELVLGGAYAEPVDGAVLLFQGESPAGAERFAAEDPYVRAGLVARWQVRRWSTVVGDAALTPLEAV